MTATAATTHTDHTDPLAGAHLNFFRILRSEWIKFFSLRSTGWSIAVTLAVMIGFSVLMAWSLGIAADTMADDPEVQAQGGMTSLDGTMAVVTSYGMAQIVMAVWGVLVISGEYSTGQIRSTLAAVPTRLPVLAAKTILVALASFVVGVIGVAGSVAASWPFLSAHDMALDLSDPTTMRVLLGVPLYLMGIAVLALAIGALLRHAAGGIAVVLGLLIVLPVLAVIDLDLIQTIAPYLPSAAGEQIITSSESMQATAASTGQPMPDALGPWQGYGVFWIYVVAAMAAAGALLRWRDA